MREGYFLVTKLNEFDLLQERLGPATVAAHVAAHVERARELKAQFVRAQKSGATLLFTDPVEAVAAGVVLLRGTLTTIPYTLSAVVLKETLLHEGEVPLAVVERSRALFSGGAKGELAITEELVEPWRSRGNRPLKRFTRKATVGAHGQILSFVDWEGPSRVPEKIQRARGILYTLLMGVPSGLLLAYLLFTSLSKRSKSDTPVLVLGPLWSDFSSPLCAKALPRVASHGMRVLSWCALRDEGIQFYRLPTGSLQLSGRVSRERGAFFLTMELTLYPMGVLYNRVRITLLNPSLEVFQKEVKKGTGQLLQSFHAPRSIVEFAQMFSLCGFDKIPPFSLGEGGRVYLKKSQKENPCLTEVVSHLPRRLLTGDQNATND